MSLILLTVDRLAHPTVFLYLLYVYSPDLQVKCSSVYVSVLISFCRMARRKIMLNTKRSCWGGGPRGPPRKLLLLIFRKSGTRCLQNVTRLPSGPWGGGRRVGAQTRPVHTIRGNPSFLFGSNQLLRGNPDRTYCLCHTNASVEDNPKKFRRCDSGKTLGAGKYRRIVFSVRYECIAWVWPKERPLL